MYPITGELGVETHAHSYVWIIPIFVIEATDSSFALTRMYLGSAITTLDCVAYRTYLDMQSDFARGVHMQAEYHAL